MTPHTPAPPPGGKGFEVRIRLRGVAAARARVRAWHPSQQLKELPGADVEITLWLNNLVDLKYDIFECGANAEAFSSPELRADVLASLLRALKRYET